VGLSLRHRSIVAAVATLLALVFSTLGHSPAAGPVDPVGLTLWALGTVSGMVAFVAAASVFSGVAAQRAAVSADHDTVRRPDPRA
jgi:hypothetical protein